ncbi:hypothetical protein KKC16_01780 [Patescibacteria group bacterium]|nr:hypothetical protein [Patescibacteria group bacterium]
MRLFKDKYFRILAILAIVFFIIYSFLPISQLVWQNQSRVLGMKFNTPDEVINYYFSVQYAKTSELYYFEPLDNFAQRVIFPRWAYVVESKITPGNFLGIDLIYGSLAKIFSTSIIVFLTPLFAVLGVLFFYLLIKLFFEDKQDSSTQGHGASPIAFVSALLMFIFPGFWYYASRTMFHNVLFLSLLIMGLYFLIKLLNTNKNKLCISILTGLFLGLALITRTSEIVWVFLLVLFILSRVPGIKFKKLKNLWLYLLLSLVIFSFCFIPVLYQHKILYNNYFSTGYPIHTVSSNLESGEIQSINYFQALVLPFGFHPRVMLFHVFYKYILNLFWLWIILYFAGLIVFLKIKKTEKEKKYIPLFIIPYSLFIYYGSWFFQDSTDPNLISLGSSYVRYFLPLFIFSLPLIAFLLVKIGMYLKKKNKIVFQCSSVLVFLCLSAFSCYQVYFANSESLISVKNQLIKYQIQNQSLLEKINPDDIIYLSAGTDKILFPERKHLIVPQDGIEWIEIKKLLNYKKVYYFHHNENTSLEELNKNIFNQENLKLENEILINGGGKLFNVIPNDL